MYGTLAVMAQHSMMKAYGVARLRDLGQRHPARTATAIVGLVYLLYLFSTTYWKLYYDADSYWISAESYFSTGSFSFASSFNYLRGYLFSLLLAPFTQLVARFGWEVVDVTKVLGAGVAAAVFGWAVPALWQAVKGGPPVPLGRRLVFAGLGFMLWRDYFNFCLTDFPALLVLIVALLALLRGRGLASGLLAGLAVGMAVNMRPVYQAAVPAVALLALLPPPGRAVWWGAVRGAALACGFIVVLLPQVYNNYYHAGVKSPLVLTNKPGQPNLFLQQLTWGLTMQKYETSVGGDYPQATMRFEDKRGQELLASTGVPEFTDVKQYIALCLEHPGPMAGVFLRHLFNGLDVQYPTPYITEVFVPTWPLAWLNYSLIAGGLMVLLGRRWRRPTMGWVRPGLVLLALLITCAAALPTAIECRFLLPLHLLLSAAVAFEARPVQWWQAASRGWRVAVSLGYVLVIVAAFSASASVQAHLAVRPRHILDDLPLSSLRPEAAPQPW